MSAKPGQKPQADPEAAAKGDYRSKRDNNWQHMRKQPTIDDFVLAKLNDVPAAG